jgi:hypothetical protein
LLSAGRDVQGGIRRGREATVLVSGTKVSRETKVNVASGNSSPLFNLREVRHLVPVWFALIVVRNGVQRHVTGILREDLISYANNRRRIHAATEFGHDWGIRAKSPPDSCAKDSAKMLLVFKVCGVANCFLWVELPMTSDDCLPFSETHVAGRRDRANSDVGREISTRKEGQPPSDVFFVD